MNDAPSQSTNYREELIVNLLVIGMMLNVVTSLDFLLDIIRLDVEFLTSIFEIIEITPFSYNVAELINILLFLYCTPCFLCLQINHVSHEA